MPAAWPCAWAPNQVTCVYRRSRRESPARAEELEHAIEEGVEFMWLTAPVEIVGDSSGWVTGMRCQKMELGEPDASGRRRPVPVPGSEFLLDVDTVIYALGTTANPIIAQTTPGLKVNKWGYIEIDEHTRMTSVAGLFAGGDIVTGAATVILAMGAGKLAARGMLEYMSASEPQGAFNMPSSCPKCHGVLEEDEICCAQVRYTWRCKSCFKLTTGFAIPYGKCFLCGGELEVIPGRDLGDSMRFRAIRDAVQFELDSFHFYKLARDKARTPEQRAVLERLYEAELDHLHELEEKYHAHLDREVVELSADEDKPALQLAVPRHQPDGRLGAWSSYTRQRSKWNAARATISRSWRGELPAGLESELCEELAAEEEEHVALLECLSVTANRKDR
jgi:glutamate synthase (NADPH/NADH) small chain